jgi:hypothetical protein
MESTRRLPEQRVLVSLVLGVVLREVFSFWTGHPTDFELWVRLGYAMLHGGNPYGSLPFVPGLSFSSSFYSDTNAPTIAYLPFWPVISGTIYLLYSVVGFGNRFVYYFLLKQPVIAGDMVLAFLLHSYVKSRNPIGSIWVLRFWAFCPFMIIISGIWGMFDSIAMCFLMVSLTAPSQIKKGILAGLATFSKSLPIIYSIPLTLGKIKDLRGLIVAIGLPAIASFAIFAIAGWPISLADSTLGSTIGKGGESMSVWDASVYLNSIGIIPPLAPGTFRILGLLWIPALIAFTVIAVKKYRFDADYGVLQSLLIVTLAFMIFKARVTEQYAIYLLALSALDVGIWNPERRKLLILTTITALAFLISNNFFLIRFASPTYPQAMVIESQLSQSIGSIRLAANFILGTVFSTLNIGYLIVILRQRGRQIHASHEKVSER